MIQLMKSALTILIAVAIYAVIHSLLASLGAKGIARRWFGAESDRWYRLAYNAFAVLSLVPVLALVPLLPDQTLYSIPSPWHFIPLAIQALAGLGLLVGVWQTGVMSFLGLQQFLEPPRKKPPALVVSGLYRWVRHPLYTAGLVILRSP